MRLSFRRSLGIVLATSALGWTGVAGAGGDDLIACREKGQISTTRNSRWTKIPAPPVESGQGPRAVTAFAAAPAAPNHMYATNGTVIKRTGDGGCTWDHMLTSSPVGEQVPNS